MKAVLVLAVALLAGCASSGGAQPEQSEAVAEQAASRQILVTVRQPATLAAGLTGAPNQRYLQRRYGPSPTVDRVLTQLAHEHGLRRDEGWPIQSLDVYCEVLTVPEGRDVAEVVAALKRDPRVDLAQPMNLFTTQTAKYDDPYLDLQSAATEMDVENAHELATGRGVSIAIIDSAVDGDHPDLRGRVRLARNLVTEHPTARGGEIHGTAIAGIIGVAPDVSIAALRACWAVGEDALAAQCSSFSLARALEVALGLQPNVINLSLAGPDDPLLSRLLDQALVRGIVVVTAYPATSESSYAFPSSHPRVLTAHSSMVRVNSDSPYTLAAPATEVLTTTPGAGYAFLSGNSLAAAHTTGVIALLMERQPDIDAERIAAILTATTTYSSGNASINACRAVARLADTEPCQEPPPSVRF